MLMKNTATLQVLILCFSIIKGYAQTDTTYKTVISEKPSCDCDSLWKKEDVADFIHLLEKATSQPTPVWPGYHLNDGTYIISAGQTRDGNHCLGLWQKGKVISYARFKNTIKMLTILYSYYLDYPEIGTIPDEPFFTTAAKVPEFKEWMRDMHISSAVYMPVDFSKLPFKVPALTKLQLAIHEAFHIEVMLRYWYTHKGSWPAWDKQPDRSGMQSCYTYNDSDRVLIRKELTILADMIDALINDQRRKACTLGYSYLKERDNRYQKTGPVKVRLGDNTDGDCKTAEAFLELEEGLADYGSWTLLYNIGMASKEDLLKRYRAQQNDHFYLSGAMLMHALTLMDKKPVERVIMEIVDSPSVEDGSLLHFFQNKLADFCER